MEKAYAQVRLNAIGNILVLMIMIIALCLKDWAIAGGLEFSLREINFKEFGGWIEIGKFKGMCTVYNISRYSDIKDDCEYIYNFEMGGILVREI